MSQKDPTPAQLEARAKASARLKAMHAAKKAAKEQETTTQPAPTFDDVAQAQVTEQPSQTAEPTVQDAADQLGIPTQIAPRADTISNNNDTQELIRLVIEMMKQNNGQVPQGANVSNGQLTGTATRYSTDVTRYPDPCDRLSKEERLQRFAFDYNYKLEFSMAPLRYQTIDKIWMVEPKFTLKLIGKVINQATGEDTGGRYVLCSMIFFEDPETAVKMANDLGLPVDEANEADFLNEMRYLRMRDWLLSTFYPEQVTTKSDTSERVIDNRVVDFYTESNATGDVKIPFDKLTRYKV